MNCCPDPKTIKIAGLDRIPLLYYLKDPARSLSDVYKRYPNGGERGWFLLVEDAGSFAFWNAEEDKWDFIGLKDAYELQEKLKEYLDAINSMFPDGRLIRDRGAWSLETAQSDNPYRYTDILQDDVWRPWGRYRCIVDKTTQEPKFGSTDWIKIDGWSDIYMTIDKGGDDFIGFGEIRIITCKVFEGYQDITDTVTRWNVRRNTGYSAADEEWNIAHKSFDGVLTLFNTAEYSDLGSANNAEFSFFATNDIVSAEHSLVI